MFDCTAYAYDQRHDKLKPKSTKYILLCYKGVKVYRSSYPTTRRTVTIRHMIFDERFLNKVELYKVMVG